MKAANFRWFLKQWTKVLTEATYRNCFLSCSLYQHGVQYN